MNELIVHFEENVQGVPHADERRLFSTALRRNPGRWALLGALKNPAVARQYAYCIRTAKENMHMFAPAGYFEAEAKTMLGTTRIYVRYTGG